MLARKFSPIASLAQGTIGYGDGYNAAKIHAASLLNGSNTYAFVTDQVDGYLFAEFEENGAIDTGIVLTGLTSVFEFAFNNIL